MPIHEFVSESTGQVVDVYVPASAPTENHQVQVIDGKEYRRVYTAPMAATNVSHGSASREDFSRVTSDKKGMTVGQMWEISAEMSQHRADKSGGSDSVKDSFYKNYEKEMGRAHAKQKAERDLKISNERLREMGIKVEL